MVGSKRHWTVSQRNLAVNLVNQGKTYHQVQQETGIPHNTVSDIMKKYNLIETTATKEGQGRKKKTSKSFDRNLIIQVKKNRFISAQKLAEQAEENYGIKLSHQTIRNRIQDQGFQGRLVHNKPYLSKKHMKRRLEFAQNFKKMPLSFWKKILWSDESKFNLKSSDGAQKVWRKAREAYKLSCVSGTVKYGGGNVMVWGSMAWKGVGKLQFIDSIMDQEQYRNMLKQNLKSSARKLRLGSDFAFQQDNDPKHSATKTKEWFAENNVEVLEWPAQSPDLNPIKHLWEILGRKIGGWSFSKKDNLKVAIKEAWEKIQPEEIKYLVESMPRRLEAVTQAKGGPTKY
ncbi:transposable element Tc1 transposase-like isoform X2 [Hydra vulgaris]|uniref:Transposable element Tc1 transposase-like isoform X2 n=1 Tax=Hydra vulgaris TaxID=6087 RepID=A0ABM4CM50_HYDVU